MKYVNANNDLQGGTLLNISNSKTCIHLSTLILQNREQI